MATGAAFGPWLLDEQLGVGGMGEVWLATHRVLGRRIAVKILSPELTMDPRFRERFVLEAKVQARLSHPHIAQIQDFLEENGRFAILMEWIPGGTVADVIDRTRGPLSIEQAVKWAGQALEALDYAHQHGVIHRDVKPSNLMLDGSGDIKVTDFGIAVAMGTHRMTTTGRSVGTPQYMSPEQIQRPQSLDHRTDVYSMGIVLYEMLAGRVPFDADTDYTLLKLHVEAPPPSLRDVNPLVPEWLESVVFRCLAKSPDDRFAGCASVAAALRHPVAQIVPVAAPELAVAEPVAEPVESAEMGAGRAAPADERSAHAPTELTEPGKGAAEELAIEPPFLRSQPAPRTPWKRKAALATGLVVIALALVWWSARPRPTGAPMNRPAQAGQTKQVPAPAAPAVPAAQSASPPAQPTPAPSDRELGALRNSIAAAVRAKNLAKARSLIEGALAKYPTDAEALEWRTLLSNGRVAHLLAKLSLNPEGQREDAAMPAASAPAPPATVIPPPAAPVIAQFAAEPASIQRGQSSTLRWQVTGSASGVTISRGVGEVLGAGTAQVQPYESTLYTLIASGPGGTTTASASVNVTIPPPPPAVRAGTTKVNPKDGLTYVWIPPGIFMMGCSPGDAGCYDDEKPAHPVTITRGFWLARTPVTQQAYQRVTGQNPSHFKGANLPVETVNWNEAKSYCEAIGGRLPTEAEWEYAARADSTGARYGNLDEIAWYSENSGGTTHEVGQKRANAFGLHDMLGNVLQFVADRSGKYESGAQSDPSGAGSGQIRLLRGGSWEYPAVVVRVSSRMWAGPGSRSYLFGLRCVGE
jgi:serine/threonine-protein kinase